MRISGQPANLLATAPIGKMLAKFAVLAIINNLITSVFNIVDQIFIGQNLGILGITGLSGMTVPIQKGYATTSLMNLPHPPISAYRLQDIVLHIQEDYLLPKHLRHIQSRALFSTFLLLCCNLSAKNSQHKYICQYCYD